MLFYMKNNTVKIILGLPIGMLFLAGCGVKTADTEPDISSSVSVSQSADDPAYHGIFNEEIFEKLCKNITINGKQVEVPGKLEDWGNGYSYERFLVNPENTEAYYCISYDNKEIGQVIYRQEEKIMDDKIASTLYIHLIIDGIKDAGSDCGIGNIFIGDTMECVTEAFGKPDNESNNEETGSCYYQYKIAENKSIGFYSHDAKIDKITIVNE
ncbi:MAG: hypothetical protein K2H89_08625 [Oscillospiraceae bacterium]|nr:hypothetical protein [Oscillospiraceae bacterium]